MVIWVGMLSLIKEIEMNCFRSLLWLWNWFTWKCNSSSKHEKHYSLVYGGPASLGQADNRRMVQHCATDFPNYMAHVFYAGIFFLNIYIRGSIISFQTFFAWGLLLIVYTGNSSPLRSNLLRLHCTCCTVTTSSGRPHGSPLVWACQWPSSQPLSSPQLSHNDSLRA